MIEEACLDSAQEILEVINASNREFFRDIIPPERFRDPFLSLDKLMADLSQMTFYAYRVEGEILGVVGLQVEGGKTGRIARLYVRPDCQRRGIGTALMAHVEEEAKGMGLVKLRLRAAEKASWATDFSRPPRL